MKFLILLLFFFTTIHATIRSQRYPIKHPYYGQYTKQQLSHTNNIKHGNQPSISRQYNYLDAEKQFDLNQYKRLTPRGNEKQKKNIHNKKNRIQSLMERIGCKPLMNSYKTHNLTITLYI